MLLNYGDDKVPPDWHVLEKSPPGYSRVYYIKGGSVTYHDKTGSRNLRTGSVYIFPSDAGYELCQDREDTLECTFMHLDLSPAAVYELVETDSEDNDFILNFFGVFGSAVRQKCEPLIRALADVFEIYCDEKGITNEYDPRISRAISYIRNNYSARIPVSKIAKISGYNEQYFIRLFRESTGLAPHRYLLNYRLREACKSLSSGEPITRIAEMTGFGDVNSFSRAFRKEFGLTPTDYRRKAMVP